MMTSSNGNIFRVTGPLCGDFTGPGEFPTERPVTRSVDVFFDLRLNKRLSKQPWGWWFETLSRPLWRHIQWRLSVQWIQAQIGGHFKINHDLVILGKTVFILRQGPGPTRRETQTSSSISQVLYMCAKTFPHHLIIGLLWWESIRVCSLWGESTGRWPALRSNNVELWCFLRW